jgi:hypothetical protein
MQRRVWTSVGRAPVDDRTSVGSAAPDDWASVGSATVALERNVLNDWTSCKSNDTAKWMQPYPSDARPDDGIKTLRWRPSAFDQLFQDLKRRDSTAKASLLDFLTSPCEAFVNEDTGKAYDKVITALRMGKLPRILASTSGTCECVVAKLGTC